MSAQTTPIPASLFATALKDLPLDTLHTKAAELQNSISHLLASNSQLQPLADEGDEAFREAIAENEEVVNRMRERIELCRKEAEGRGLSWHLGGEAGEEKVNGVNGANASATVSGSLTDEELRRRLEESLGGEGEDEEGVHL